MHFLSIEGLSKSYPGAQALADFDLTLDEGQIVALLGPSGCGKTTLLRVIAGLEAPDSGHISLNGESIDGVLPHQRDFGLMFQDYALFPHMNVFDNVAFGLQMRGLPTADVEARVRQTLGRVGLVGFEQRDVNALSGGERQRVALARSLAPNPQLLMLDEPLGSLDRSLRERLMSELHAILKQVGVTALYVTHDQEETFAVADRLVIMREGRKVQEGAPETVYRRPADEWVARFLGLTNLLDGRVESADAEHTHISTHIGNLTVDADGHAPFETGQNVRLLIHPEGARVTSTPGDRGPNLLHGLVESRSFRGGDYLLGVRHASGEILTFRVNTFDQLVPDVGETMTLDIPSRVISSWKQENP